MHFIDEPFVVQYCLSIFFFLFASMATVRPLPAALQDITAARQNEQERARPSEERLRSLSRRQLQKQAKKFGVKANSKSDAIIAAILSQQGVGVDGATQSINEEAQASMPVRKKKGLKTPYKMKQPEATASDTNGCSSEGDALLFRTRSIFTDTDEVFTVKIGISSNSGRAAATPPSSASGTTADTGGGGGGGGRRGARPEEDDHDDIATLGKQMSDLRVDDSEHWPWLVTDAKNKRFLRCTLTGERVRRDEVGG